MPEKARHRWLGWGTWAVFLSTLLAGACQQAREEPAVLPVVTSPELNYSSESELLNDTFRIDLTPVRVRLVYFPEQRLVQGRAVLDFRMRPGQRRPLFRFETPGPEPEHRATGCRDCHDGSARVTIRETASARVPFVSEEEP